MSFFSFNGEESKAFGNSIGLQQILTTLVTQLFDYVKLKLSISSTIERTVAFCC